MAKFAGKVRDKTGIQIGLVVIFVAVCSLGWGMFAETSVAVMLALLGVALIGCAFEKHSIVYYMGSIYCGIILLGVILGIMIFFGELFGSAFLAGMAHLLELCRL